MERVRLPSGEWIGARFRRRSAASARQCAGFLYYLPGRNDFYSVDEERMGLRQPGPSLAGASPPPERHVDAADDLQRPGTDAVRFRARGVDDSGSGLPQHERGDAVSI